MGISLLVLGLLLLILGWALSIGILYTIGIILVVVGAILAILDYTGHGIGRRGPP